MSQRHVLNTFVFKQLASLRKLEELAMKFEQAQISRKLAGKRGTSLHKLKTCDDLRSRLIRALQEAGFSCDVQLEMPLALQVKKKYIASWNSTFRPLSSRL